MILEELSSSIVDLFARNYFGHLSLAFHPWQDLEEMALRFVQGGGDVDQLEAHIWKRVRTDHPSSRFPVSAPHRQRAAAWLRRVLRRPGGDAGELMVEPEEDHIFKTYEFSGDDGLPRRVVLLEENRDPMSSATTGLISWQGARALLEWASALGPGALGGRRVLEIGSGAGLFGLALLAGCAGEGCMPKGYIFTDGHPKVIQFLGINLSINLGKLSGTCASDLLNWTHSPPTDLEYHNEEGQDHSPVNVCRLDWTCFSASDLPPADVVVGSDLVYSPALVPGLCALIAALLRRNSVGVVAYIACTRRNGHTVDLFLEELRKVQKLKYEVVFRRTFSPSEGIMVNHEPLKPVFVYKIVAET